jgi:N-acetylglucosaminyldiphosphoundecaprenol N-acetyl-beta-D-mannosaminyltransferase
VHGREKFVKLEPLRVTVVATNEPDLRPAPSLLGTPLQTTAYADWTAACQAMTRRGRPTAVDFSNTHIVSLRRHDREFRELTSCFDYFVPDGMPLIWCLNAGGAGMKDRVYGPTFMRHCILNSPAPYTHYFLGGSEECLVKLRERLVAANPAVQICGMRHGYFSEAEAGDIVAEINRLLPDFIWVGLGTPKQQAWIRRHKQEIRRGVLLAVGFAFDVNAGTKQDAPAAMQRLGLTWLYRLASEPLRLGPRYVKYNSLFLFYLLWDALRGRALVRPPAGGKSF